MNERDKRVLRGEYGASESDRAISAVKAALSVVPLGGAIASLLGDYLPKETDRVVRRTLIELAERLNALEHRIDAGAVDRDEFAELFKSSYLLILRSHKQERLDAAVALLVNLLLKAEDPAKLPYTELDHFARSLELLSTGALHVLVRIAELDEKWSSTNGGHNRISFSDIAERLQDTDPSLLMGLVSELNAMNLVDFPAVSAASTPEHGNQPIEMTPLGKRFVAHILKLKPE